MERQITTAIAMNEQVPGALAHVEKGKRTIFTEENREKNVMQRYCFKFRRIRMRAAFMYHQYSFTTRKMMK